MCEDFCWLENISIPVCIFSHDKYRYNYMQEHMCCSLAFEAIMQYMYHNHKKKIIISSFNTNLNWKKVMFLVK